MSTWSPTTRRGPARGGLGERVAVVIVYGVTCRLDGHRDRVAVTAVTTPVNLMVCILVP